MFMASAEWRASSRRLAKDFENFGGTLATFVTLASVQLALRRLGRPFAAPLRRALPTTAC
jgi:hypothetical protein